MALGAVVFSLLCTSGVSAGAQQPVLEPIVVTGTERLAWDQAESDATSLAEFSFTAFVDGVPEPLEDVTCAPIPDRFGFECSSRLPRMEPGPHSIELTAMNGSTEVSEHSALLLVVFRSRPAESVSLGNPTRLTGGLGVEQVVGGLVDVADIAALPDGSVLIGEERGRILSMRPGESPITAIDLRSVDRSSDTVTLLALATAPDFGESHAVFAAYLSRGGLRLVRLTEFNGVLLDHAVLRENVPMGSALPRAAIAVGPDGKIYLALAGQVLRLNLDGSTPKDGPTSGVFAIGVQQPEVVAWSAAQRVMWLLGTTTSGDAELRIMSLGDRGSATTLKSFTLARIAASAMVLATGSSTHESRLLVADRASGDLLQWQVRFPEVALDQATWIPRDSVGDVTALSSVGDRLWLATRSDLFRVTLPR